MINRRFRSSYKRALFHADVNGRKIIKKFIYLDWWDVDWKNLILSAPHIFVEFLNFFPHLRLGDILLVDDAPKTSIILEIVQEKK